MKIFATRQEMVEANLSDIEEDQRRLKCELDFLEELRQYTIRELEAIKNGTAPIRPEGSRNLP